MMGLRRFYDFSKKFQFQWTRFGRLAIYNIATLTFETVAVTILLPIMMFIERRGDTALMREESRVVNVMFSIFDRVGIAPTFANLLLIAFSFVVARQCLVYVRLVESSRIQESFLRDIRHGLFTRFNAAVLEFQERTKVGEFVNAIVVEARRTVLGFMTMVELAVLILMFAVYLGILVGLSPWLTIAVFVLLALVGIGMRGVMLRTIVESRQVVSSNADMLGFLNERLAAPRLIRLCGMEQTEADEFHRYVNRQVDTTVAIRRSTAIGEVVVEPAVVGVAFLIIAYAYQALNMQLATISLFLFIMLRLLPLAKSFVTLRQGILAGMGSLEVVDNLYCALEKESEGAGGLRRFDGIRKDISLDNVSFSYPGAAQPALSNVTLRLPRGTITALVGPSGGGKSTLIDLLPRLRIPAEGSIRIDGFSSQEFNLDSLRRGIAFAPQAPQMFDVTIGQHIRYGRADADDPQVLQAAKLAGAANFIAALPNGFHTRLGPAAHQLSGGQKQRIDLARVLASEAELLIFDEPTSNLDNESEGVFQQALWNLRQAQNVTVIVIAHRLQLVNWADQIVVLNDGRIEAAGTHDEVFAASRWYHQAYLREMESDPASRIEQMKSRA